MHYDLPALAILKSTLLLSAIAGTCAALRIERKPIRKWTASLPGFGKRLSFCFLSGAALVIIYIASIYSLGGYFWGVRVIMGAKALSYALEWLFVSAIYGLADSLAIFGYPVVALRHALGPVPACIITAICFTAIHVVWFDAFPIGVCALLAQGLFLCAVTLRTSSIFPTAAVYAGAVFAQDFLFSVADSGTKYGQMRNSYLQGPNWLTGVSAGPKASLSALIVYLLALIAVVWSGVADRRHITSRVY